MRVGILCGGWSREREISLLTGKKVYESLRRQGYECFLIDLNQNFAQQIREAKIDLAFICLHGKPGEDGTIQGFLELLGIPYTGSGVGASAVGMDKILTKIVFSYYSIPTPEFFLIEREEDVQLAIEKLGLPIVLKPRYEGSSIGVKILREKEDVLPAVLSAKEEFGSVFLEEYIPGMNATCGILADKPLPILELVPKRQEFYDYKAKYTEGETEFICPARISEDLAKKIQKLSLLAHKAIGCRCYSRLDLVICGEKPYFLEINTLPGLTELSDLPKEAEVAGISYDELILTILKWVSIRNGFPNQILS
ncbi:MAG: D-alanine--D-alanine ligase [candidate division WOR-3 bacterium]